MSNVLRSERALQALRLAKAFAQLRGPVRRSSALTGREETPPASGLRRISPCDLGGAEPLALIPAVDPPPLLIPRR
jgi:hypothetical protein